MESTSLYELSQVCVLRGISSRQVTPYTRPSEQLMSCALAQFEPECIQLLQNCTHIVPRDDYLVRSRHLHQVVGQDLHHSPVVMH